MNQLALKAGFGIIGTIILVETGVIIGNNFHADPEPSVLGENMVVTPFPTDTPIPTATPLPVRIYYPTSTPTPKPQPTVQQQLQQPSQQNFYIPTSIPPYPSSSNDQYIQDLQRQADFQQAQLDKQKIYNVCVSDVRGELDRCEQTCDTQKDTLQEQPSPVGFGNAANAYLACLTNCADRNQISKCTH